MNSILKMGRGHGGHRVQGPHALPAALHLHGDALHGGTRMTGNRNPRYALHDAVVKLADPALVEAWRAALQFTPSEHELSDKVLAINAERRFGRSGAAPVFSYDRDDCADDELAPMRREAAELRDTALCALRSARSEAAKAAFYLDFLARLHDGSITAWAIDPDRPASGEAKLHPDIARRLTWYGWELGLDGQAPTPAIKHLRFCAADGDTASTHEAAKVDKPKGHHSRADAPLLDEMAVLVERDGMTVRAASMKLASRARGGGGEDSKATRLAKAYRKRSREKLGGLPNFSPNSRP